MIAAHVYSKHVKMHWTGFFICLAFLFAMGYIYTVASVNWYVNWYRDTPLTRKLLNCQVDVNSQDEMKRFVIKQL